MVQCVESLGQVHKYICFISFIQVGSRTIAPRGKFPPNTKTNPNPILNPNQGTLFLRGNCLVAPPSPNPKTNPNLDRNRTPIRGAVFLGGGGGGGGSFILISQFPKIFSSACCALWFLRNPVYIFGKFITHYMYQFESK